MAKNVLFLAGAPHVDSLDWDDENRLATDFCPPVRRFLGDEIEGTELALTAASYPLAKWRDVPLIQQKETIVVAANALPRDATKFASFQGNGDEEDEHLQFLEYSLAILQNLDSSQIGPPDDTTVGDSAFVTGGSFGTFLSMEPSMEMSSDSLASYSSEKPEQQILNFSSPVVDLNGIPNARHLKSIHPQTMTVNVLASVISVQPARTVRLRKRSGEMDIVEVLLGDETKAGFTTTFWLTPVESQAGRPPASNARQNGVREMLCNLRSGDVLLLTHIALSEFNSNVFGQSLSRRTARNNTTVTVLSSGATGLSAPLLAKLKRVREWAANFIGQGVKRAGPPGQVEGQSKKPRAEALLPPDTQYE